MSIHAAMTDDAIQRRLRAVERRQAGLLAAIVLLLACVVVTVGAWWQLRRTVSAHRDAPKELTVRRLAIVDAKGVERVVLGAPLPAPRLYGRTRSRGSADGVSGMLIFDATGTERGGYVTDDGRGNAMLTLDARGRQVFLLLAEPDEGPFLKLWNRDAQGRTTGSITMGAYDGPFLNLRRNDQPAFSVPEGNPESTDPRPLFR